MDAAFAKAVVEGLSKKNKSISSQYFYDDKGSELFQQIMEVPEYYPTRCETEILNQHAPSIAASLHADHPLEIVELGAGDGSKTQILLREFLHKGREVIYRPIDISAGALQGLQVDLEAKLPGLKVKGLQGEYFQALSQLEASPHPRLVLFLGSNIGNFNDAQAIDFLYRLRSMTAKGDYLFVGFDLRKNPHIILGAYNDAQGVTREFNFNLLRRINEELEADINLEQWAHYPTYDPFVGQVRSYLVSLCEQEVFLKNVNTRVFFKRWESIHTETSNKFTPEGISMLASSAGYTEVAHWEDQKGYFRDCLWR